MKLFEIFRKSIMIFQKIQNYKRFKKFVQTDYNKYTCFENIEEV